MKDGFQTHSPDLEDPLSGLTGLLLFPRTFRDSMIPMPSPPDDLEAIHAFMKAMALRDPRKHLEKAKAILNGNPELLNSNIASFLASEGKYEAATTEREENSQEQKLELDQARFSLKPNSSLRSVRVEPSLDIDQLQDPEEFFLAHERLENATKDLQKQMGGSKIDLNEHNISKTVRPRRPGILGKSVTYKHRQSSLLLESDDTFVSSQVPLEQGILSPSNHLSQIETSVATKGKENAHAQRRAQFSLKPYSSHPFVSAEPSLDIDSLQDPEEFFLAHERLENAKKELQKQMGGNMIDLNEHNISKTVRRRRPGILGKSVSYQHRYTVLPEVDNTFTSSQVPLGPDVLSPPNHVSQLETADPSVEFKEKELIGSISKTENGINEILDELFDNCENLGGDGVLSFLQERLQIKPLDLDKLCLPEFHDVGKHDFMDLGEILPKPRNTLSDIQNLVKGISGKTPVKRKQVAVSPAHSLASPTPPKSPFASVSLLQKHILQSNLLNDPFSVLNLSPAGNNSSVEHVDEQADHHYTTRRKLEVSGKLTSLVPEISDITVDDNGNRNRDARFVDDNDRRLDTDIDAWTNCHAEMEENDNKLDTDIWETGPNEMEENVGDMLQEAVSSGDVNFRDSFRSCTDFQADRPNEMEDNVIQTDEPNETEKNVEDMSQNAQPDISIEHRTTGILNDESAPAAFGSHAMDGPAETSDVIPDHIENVQEPSRVLVNERRKEKRAPQKRKTLALRQSLAGAGTFWEAGVRRSKRIKMRPLEYWKGERFLYGRIHESLTTVIGVKYVSPAKGDGKPCVKVKSYVSDEYKELVELAALH